MDKETRKGQKVTERKEVIISDERLSELYAKIDKKYDRTRQELEEKLKSHWIGRKDKSYIRMFKGIINTLKALEQDNVSTLYLTMELRKQCTLLTDTLVETMGVVGIEVPALEAEIDKLKKAINDPMIAHVYNFIQERKKILEKQQNAGDEYIE